MESSRFRLTCLLLATVLPLAGCATKKYVRGEVGSSEERTAGEIAEVASRVEEAQTRLDEQDVKLGELSTTAREALERAIAAGKLAEGRFLFETVLTDDKIRFGFDQATLSDEAAAALDEFAAGLRERNENVYVEIQGHTDAVGDEEYNLRLGERRAAAVRRYLNLQHGLALHRMSVISYGESEPIADNDSREGRSQNRRVALIVLK